MFVKDQRTIVWFAFLIILVTDANCGVIHNRTVFVTDDNAMIQAECFRYKCQQTDVCYVPHPEDCFRFIICQPKAGGTFFTEMMTCAFGTMWKAEGYQQACELAELVDCLNDPCRYPNIRSHDHIDDNPRTFWQCVDGRSVPSCCGHHRAYDDVKGKCVKDITSTKLCPLMNDDTCLGHGVNSIDFPDGNCKTYWGCKNRRPHPVCCPDGTAYDVFQAECSYNKNCTDKCPGDYIDICTKRGISSYGMNDGNCRTYLKCNKDTGLDEPYCCRAGMEFDNKLKKCVLTSKYKCLNALCPRGYIEECRYESVPGKPKYYRDIDAGNLIRPAPVGTEFSDKLCRFVDARDLHPPVVGVCEMDIHLELPDLKNHGAVIAAILMLGAYGQGERSVGNMTTYWNGNDGINIPFYGSQSFSNLHLEIRFRPTPAPASKQVLLSSCKYDIGGVPTLELSLMAPESQTGGTITLQTRSDKDNLSVDIPYMVDVPYLLRIFYDGETIGVFLETQDLSAPTVIDRRKFSGSLEVDVSGLRFAHCRYDQNSYGFVGFVSEIELSRCLTPEKKNALYPHLL